LPYVAVTRSAVTEAKRQKPRSSSFSPGASWFFLFGVPGGRRVGRYQRLITSAATPPAIRGGGDGFELTEEKRRCPDDHVSVG
jgi:hypothetical protein